MRLGPIALALMLINSPLKAAPPAKSQATKPMPAQQPFQIKTVADLQLKANQYVNWLKEQPVPLNKAQGQAYLQFKVRMFNQSKQFEPATQEATRYLFGAIDDYLFPPYKQATQLDAIQARFNTLITHAH